MIDRPLRWVLRRRAPLALAWGLVVALAAPGLLRLEHDNSAEVFFVRDAEALARYRAFTETFGDFGSLRVVAEGAGLWTPEGLQWLRRLEAETPGIRGVVGAAGLRGLYRSRFPDWRPAELATLRELARADPLARRAGWVSADGQTVSTLLILRRLSAAERRNLLTALEALLAEVPAGIEARLAGLPLVNRAFDQTLAHLVARFFPLIGLVGVALLALALRSPTAVAAPLLLVAACEVIVCGAMGWLGVRLNLVTGLLPALILVLGLAGGVHLLIRFRQMRHRGLERDRALVTVYREKTWPVLWSGLTTGVAFGSMATSPAPPIRALGAWTALGIALATLGVFTLLPALLSIARPGPDGAATRFERTCSRFGRRLAGSALLRPRPVLFLFGLLLALALAGLPRLRLETGLLSYFRPAHTVRADLEATEARGVGTVSVDLILERKGGSFRDPESLARLDRIAANLRAEPRVLGAVSPADLLGRGVPEERLDDFLEQGLAVMLNEDSSRARVTIFVPLAGFSELSGVFARAESESRRIFPEATARVTGRYPMVLAAQSALLRTLSLSFGLTLLCVAALFALLLRGGGLTLRALGPNLLPVVAVLGLIGWLRLPVESVTVMIAAVALGLAVDNTLHFVGEYRRTLPELEPAEAVRSALERLAPAHILTSLVLAVGFGVLGFSDFLPVARFGALTAAAVLVALVGDLALLPALMARIRRPVAAAGGRPPRPAGSG